MGRFRKRKPTVAWLPLLGQGQGSNRSYIADGLAIAFNGDIVTAVHSLVPDYPAESVQNVQVESLADYQESGYRLRRVVGKIYVAANQYVGDGQNTYPTNALVGAGLIVLRVDATTGAPLRAATPSYYSPLDRDNTRDPWIWRRTWLVSNSFAVPPGVSVSGNLEFPRTNAEYGSAWDGPHIDQKTARKVSAEERLFLVISTQWPQFGTPGTQDGGVVYTYEARYLTSPLRVMGNRHNASR